MAVGAASRVRRLAVVRPDAGAHRPPADDYREPQHGDLPDGNNGSQRADRAAGVSLYPATDRRAVVQPGGVHGAGAGTWGNAGRNIVRAPGLFQVDLACRSASQWRARNFEFRAEAFNAFNRVNLGAPGTTLTSPASFGRITGPLNRGYGTGTARQMQFMFRFDF